LKKSIVTYVHISLLYSFAVGLGLYGWNVDYFVYMDNPNNIWRPSEFIGGALSTLTIEGVYLGGYVVAFFLAYSILIFNHAYFRSVSNKYKKIEVIFISILALHMWPIIIASTNALRQGLALAFILLLVSYTINSKSVNIFKIFLVIFLLTFSHKMGMLYSSIIVFIMYISSRNSKTKKYKSWKFTVIYISLFSFFSMLILKYFKIISSDHTRSTGFDMSYLLFGFLLIVVSLYLYKWNSFKNTKLIQLRFFIILAFSATAPFLNQSLVYERLVWPIFIFSLFEIITLLKWVNFRYTLVLILLFLSGVSTVRFIFLSNIFP
jgi:hypothetical protein